MQGDSTIKAETSTSAPQKVAAKVPSSSADGKYSCVRLMSRNGTTVFEPAGLGFTIQGTNYSVVSGTGGKAATSGSVTEFAGGRLDKWRGEIRSNSTGTYLFFRSNATEIRLGESAKFGDIQCYRR
jgi:hypothetical protein